MIAIGIEYLNGTAVATDPASYDDPEWPPHPARVFMSFAAAHFEQLENGSGDTVERHALEWLERLPPPEIAACAGNRRATVKHYVPVNDRKKEGILPRVRQERYYPTTVLGDACRVWLLWPDVEAQRETRNALDRLAERVCRIGHSSSFVRVHVTDAPDAPVERWAPVSSGLERLRVTASGLLAALEDSFQRGHRPVVGSWQAYVYGGVALAPDPPVTVFDDRVVVLRLREGRALDITYTLRLTEALRKTFMSGAAQPVPEVISGHAPDGNPSQRPHAALVPLGYIAGDYADAHLMGLGLILPGGLSLPERLTTLGLLSRHLQATDRVLRLKLGRLGLWDLEVDRSEQPPYSLDPVHYTRPSDEWWSVTPVVLDRFTADEKEQREIISAACERIGLPTPSEVYLSRYSRFRSVPPAWEFPPLQIGKSAMQRYHLHAVLRFSSPVRGPVLLGAGRYRGYGLMRRPENRA